MNFPPSKPTWVIQVLWSKPISASNLRAVKIICTDIDHSIKPASVGEICQSKFIGGGNVRLSNIVNTSSGKVQVKPLMLVMFL